MTEISIHDTNYLFLGWEDLGKDIFSLAKQIITQGDQYDRVIALAKGGLTFSRSLVDFLDVAKLSSIHIELYTGINSKEPTPVITQSLPISIRNERILIFDDIIDSGDTIHCAVNYLQQHGPSSIATAALLNKPWASYQADFIARTSKAWVIFPNEVRETIKLLQNDWIKKGDTEEQIFNQLLQIGFSKEEVELFANLK